MSENPPVELRVENVHVAFGELRVLRAFLEDPEGWAPAA